MEGVRVGIEVDVAEPGGFEAWREARWINRRDFVRDMNQTHHQRIEIHAVDTDECAARFQNPTHFAEDFVLQPR